MKVKKKGNGQEKIAKTWKKITLDLFIAHPDLNATEVRNQLVSLLGEEKTPGISAVQKEWARLRIENDKIKDFDNPWHMGLMAEKDDKGNLKYPDCQISPEALFYISQVQRFCELKKENPFISSLEIILFGNCSFGSSICICCKDDVKLP